MYLNQFLMLSAVLFCLGVYGVLARKNGVLVLMSIELMLNAVNINLVAFGAFRHVVAGQVFALFVITIAAAQWLGREEPREAVGRHLTWFELGRVEVGAGIHVDGLTVMMLIVVTFIS